MANYIHLDVYTWPFHFENKSVPRKQTMNDRKVATSVGPLHNNFLNLKYIIVKLSVRFWKYFLTILCSVFNYNIYCSVFDCRV
jgi:hypothetical protein